MRIVPKHKIFDVFMVNFLCYRLGLMKHAKVQKRSLLRALYHLSVKFDDYFLCYSKSNNNLYTLVGSINRADSEGDSKSLS